MRTLVTGGTGFLGGHLTKALKTAGDDVVSLGSKDADLTKQGSLSRFDEIKFDRIFHLAAWTQAGDFCLHHPGEQWLINQAVNTNVLTWWHSIQPQAKLISMGSSCSYEENSASLSEEHYLEGQPIPGLFTYGMTKRMMHIGQASLNKQFGLKYLTIIPSTLYGPGYHTENRQLHFIFDVIRKTLDFKYKGTPVVLWGDGFQRRELVFVDDFVDALMSLAISTQNDLVNIGAGEDYSIREFSEIVCEMAAVDPAAVQYDTSRYVGAKSKKLDTRKLDSLLPNRRKTSLREGLRQTVQWFEESHYAPRKTR